MSQDGYYAPRYVAPPPPPVSPGAPPPYEGVVANTNIPLGFAVVATLTSALGFLAYYLKPGVQENIIYVDKPVPFYVNNTIEVEKVVYVDKPYTVDRTVYIDKPYVVEKTIEVTRDIPVEKIIYVDKIVDAQCPELVTTTKIIHEYIDPYNGL